MVPVLAWLKSTIAEESSVRLRSIQQRTIIPLIMEFILWGRGQLEYNLSHEDNEFPFPTG